MANTNIALMFVFCFLNGDFHIHKIVFFQVRPIKLNLGVAIPNLEPAENLGCSEVDLQ